MESYYQPELKLFSDTIRQALMYLSDKDDDKEDRQRETSFLDELSKYREFAVHFQAKIQSYQSKLVDDRVRRSIVSAGAPESSLVGASVQHQFAKIKEIEPSIFNGDLTKFFEWKNLFSNLIHSRPPYEMGNTLKLYYLKKSMVGKAEDLLTNFVLPDEDYIAAWDFVMFRFEKRRSIVKAFFRKLQYLESIKSEHSSQKLLDSTNRVIRGLTAADEEINETFARFLAFHTEDKCRKTVT